MPSIDQTAMTSGFHIIAGNAMEILAQGLAELLGNPRSNPLRPEIVLVQSKGMQKWVSLAIAEHNGICANIDFPFPNAFLNNLYSNIIGSLPAVDPYEPQVLQYRIMQILPDFLERNEFIALHQYLTENRHPLKLFQLSRKIADIFDQYSIFRPDMILEWERGITENYPSRGMANRQVHRDHQWQIILWQALTAQISCPNRAQRQQELIGKLSGSAGLAPLPERLMVFGISHLPPYHLRVLEALAMQLPVYLFLLNPCRHYWSDIISDRQRAYLHGKLDGRFESDERLHLETGNRLLASMGQQGREFFDAIYQIQGNMVDAFRDIHRHSLLGRLQQDILDLIDHRIPVNGADPELKNDHTSIRIHNCHSPMREIEVLLDQLLDIISKNPDIAPRDILVMAPDINEYLPYIHAVFGVGSSAHTSIPYTVSDQSILSEVPDTECFLKLLGIFQERFEASRILALLEFPVIQNRYGLKSSDLPIIERWVEMTGIRWGWDAQGRRQYGLPGYAENTWRIGLDRLLMGYAMAVENGLFVDEILPFATIEGDQSRILGGLVLFAESLQCLVEQLAEKRTLTSWQSILSDVIQIFFSNSENAGGNVHLLKDAVRQLGDIASAADFLQPIGFDVVYEHLKEAFGRTAFEAGFFSGGVTFCAMLPMRSIPAQVICLLGMNHDAFPREMHEPAFNLIAADPRPGDRSKRSDDRYIFLESLISARRIIYLSYIGQDIQDNTIKPPSVIIDELCEYIHERFNIPSDKLIIEHPLHAFSPRYFSLDDPHLFSHNLENYNASLALRHPQEPQPFFKSALPALEDQVRHYELADLISFFTQPTRFLLEKRLGVFFRKTAAPIADRELFSANALDKYFINNQLASQKAKMGDTDNAFALLNASGLLPHGSVGRAVYGLQKTEVESFMGAFEPFMPHEEPWSEIISVGSVGVDSFQLDGLIQGLHSQARVVLRIAKTRPRDLIHLFLNHLMLLLGANEGLPQTSRLICMDEIWEIGPIQEAVDVLQTFLTYYWKGMHAPLPFFEQSSYAYARKRLINSTSHALAMMSAMKIWQGDNYRRGESKDPNNRRCFNNARELPEGFEQTALAIFEPILHYCRPLNIN